MARRDAARPRLTPQTVYLPDDLYKAVVERKEELETRSPGTRVTISGAVCNLLIRGLDCPEDNDE